jgi:hypothetical protein
MVETKRKPKGEWPTVVVILDEQERVVEMLTSEKMLVLATDESGKNVRTVPSSVDAVAYADADSQAAVEATRRFVSQPSPEPVEEEED